MQDALWAEWIELRVRLAIGAFMPSGFFTLDDPTYSRLDYARLGGSDEPWVDVTCDVRQLSWQSGATRTDGVLTRWEAGSAVIVLGNEDAKYDISEPDPIYVPMVPVKIDARLKKPTLGAWVDLWYGYADSWTLSFDTDLDALLTVAATDGTKVLSAYNGPEQSPVGNNDTAAQRVDRLLTEAGWTDARDITAGGYAMAATTIAQDIWTELLLTIDTELGALYIDQSGALAFRPRSVFLNAIASGAPVASFGPDAGQLRYEDAAVITDDVNLRNAVDAARVGGTVVSVRDTDSVQRYKMHRWGRSDLIFSTQPDVEPWARLVLETSNSPAPRVDGLVVMPLTQPAALFARVLATDYGDKWTVDVQPPGTAHFVSRIVQVRGWQHSVDNENWTANYALSDATWGTFFYLDGGPNGDAVLDVMRLF